MTEQAIWQVSLEPPRWVHHPSHMKGWEAFGVTDDDRDPIVRRLGEVTIVKGEARTDVRPGTGAWGPGEIKLGVGGISIVSSADALHAYIYVVGTTKADVEARWRTARSVWNEVAERLWPASRPRHIDGEK